MPVVKSWSASGATVIELKSIEPETPEQYAKRMARQEYTVEEWKARYAAYLEAERRNGFGGSDLDAGALGM